jgi:hypothetical protein
VALTVPVNDSAGIPLLDLAGSSLLMRGSRSVTAAEPGCYWAKEVSTAIMRSSDMQPSSEAMIRSAPAVVLASI